MSDLTANQIAHNEAKVTTEIRTLRAEITDRAEMIATFAQNGGLTLDEKGKTAAVSGRAALDVQIAAWRSAFDAEIAAATAEQIAAAKAMCVECGITTAWF
jgi:hypothetical protein